MATAPPPPPPPRTRDSQTILLPDGRTLGFAEYGTGSGTPIIYLHGYPTSRLEAYALDALARRRRLRLLALDRPGFGLSSPQPGRRIADWPADVAAFANQQRLARFAVLGVSGGGPYALACAAAAPLRGVLAGVGLLASAPPPDRETWGQLPRVTRLGYAAARYFPALTRVLLSGLIGLTRWAVATGPVARWIDALLDQATQQRREKEFEEQRHKAETEGRPLLAAENAEVDDDATRPTAERRAALVRMAFDGFAQGSGAAVQEARLLNEDWGISLQDVDHRPLYIWHGADDARAPVQLVRGLARRLPTATLVEFPGAGHVAVGHYFDRVLAELVPSGGEGNFQDGVKGA
ncbi:Alpha/Beta hydrolase protein [Lasiosphaeria miniovina]|uniref:Alpha/Beta hydrolase protein n=1 Tax=Lasiosphaeria miniovina TaxID=1954250 RepID=A0AA40ALG6_9PEZI|nr:Alpha/Beta hydrolase protein [Lasiosphaeria miniovina]KAK0718022.1 Alpha/Beta hydrolase protein [Lasiosphaeria miniovina]